jgi:hypothetical protein
VVPSWRSRPAADSGDAAFDADAADVLNERMPLSVLERIALSNQLPDALRRDVAAAALTRALLLGERARAADLASALGSLAPELRHDLEPVGAASDPATAEGAGWLLLLRNPGLKPYIPIQRRATPVGRLEALRDNWWCGFSAEPADPGFPQYAPVAPYETRYTSRTGSRFERPLRSLYLDARTIESPTFLSDPERIQAARELEALAARGAAPTDLGRHAVAFARAHPADPRAPEALHLAVRATRYGCTDEGNGRVSRAAFDLLHRRYPDSGWAKRTKYWYR